MSDDTQNIGDIPTLQEQLAQAQQNAEHNLDGWKRAKADYLNLKKEMEKEKVELAQFANLSLLLELLPVADNFDRAVQHIPDDQKNADWVKGIFGIQQQLKSIFATLGVAPVETDGAFNPELHEAVGSIAHESAAPNTVVEVVEPGYTLYGKLLRPAKVKVAQ